MTWPTVPLKRVASLRVSNVDKKSVDGEQPVRLCNYTDVYYRDSIRADQEFMVATASGEKVAAFRLRPGDVIITKDSETSDDIGVPAYVEAGAPDLICGYHLALIRPDNQAIGGRFLFWSMASAVVRDQLASSATGVTRFGLRTDSIGGVVVPVPARNQQLAIAEFLDTETARIDALIAKKRCLAGLLLERRSGRIELAIRGLAAAHGEVALKFVVEEVVVGIVVTPAAWYTESESGVAALRGVNLQAGRIHLDDLVQITGEGHALHRKSELRAGDVVVVRTGQAGAAAVVPLDLAGANCIDLIVIRPAGKLVPKFLEYVLNSDWTQKHVQEHSVGTIQSHFNVFEMKNLPVPRAPTKEQLVLLDRLADLTWQIDGTVVRLKHQIALLQERRQALITAAVTGELDIAGAA